MRKRYVVFIIVIGLTFPLFGAQENYSIILKKNIFTESVPKPPPPVLEKTPIIKPAPPPSLNSLINLIGIAYFPENGSYAVLRVQRKNEELVFQEGDVVENAKILKIEEDGVIFLYNEKEEVLSFKLDNRNEPLLSVAPGLTIKLDEKSETEKREGITENKVVNPTAVPVPEFADPVYIEKNAALEEIRKDTELFKKVNIAPKMQNGKVDGFQVTNLPLNSLPYKYGLRDGDIVRRVNGVFIDSISKGFSVYNQVLKEGTEIVSVEIIRNNSPLVLTFQLR
ncbi:MAG: hypothetical protein ACOX1Z_03765 [Candidatus Ratteibacteria bacterium]|jgi:type II secretion system protein C